MNYIQPYDPRDGEPDPDLPDDEYYEATGKDLVVEKLSSRKFIAYLVTLVAVHVALFAFPGQLDATTYLAAVAGATASYQLAEGIADHGGRG